METLRESFQSLQSCYMFLECNPNDTETTIRENFYYKISEGYRETMACPDWHHLYYDYASNGDSDEKMKLDYYRELQLIHQDIELLCASYLAIILSRKDPEQYKNFIKGLVKMWYHGYPSQFLNDTEFNPYFALRFPREDENIEMLEPDYITKEEYLKRIDHYYHELHYHGYGCVPTLGIIIELEKEIMDKNMVIKRYMKRQYPLGRIKVKNEQAIKLERIEQNKTEGRHIQKRKV